MSQTLTDIIVPETLTPFDDATEREINTFRAAVAGFVCTSCPNMMAACEYPCQIVTAEMEALVKKVHGE